ncbi:MULTISPECIES: 50S ribosomal protein L11 methyltransferase [Sphingomonadales]|uniref:50S ribosomal protein L11 methyltransferase n=1 Tax=Sphingomonadales TaxID=204457 RepID=UPI0001DD08C9|nr:MULTISPECIES: 50S ribosomal protein L11 methyltransferase [Sphingomonadales]ALG61678.1 ribonucleotide-diphosphate reductase subunit beta [Citromicrobium sp. JL477]KPM12875.1 ribonucleotide-diphosphate reductase subunit beta [Citromicrobium sp. JL1351]KPM21096.1 ribonucleotide-diphosphate reductase subunit beta [Citromicrobium sp. JL31]KPM27082.1 ribonucleotide-diphosphate reductase subunit beta [Citromicrobium sp. JL2201]
MSADITAEEAGISWKLTALVDRTAAEAALAASVEDAWDSDLVMSAHEVEADRYDPINAGLWRIEAWYPRKPDAALRATLDTMFDGNPPDFTLEKVEPEDWVTISQQAVEPVRAGPFHIRTPDHAAAPEGIDLVIPASRAFGTGQHETTAGCLAMLGWLRARGVHPRDIADIGTGTGLLAIGALKLFPTANVIASDIDPVCDEIVRENAHGNAVPLGQRPGALHYVTAPGMDDPGLRARAPYDLLIANILAGPLITLAPDFARAVQPGAYVVLAGLLTTQEARVTRAYLQQGLRREHRIVDGDWSILCLRMPAR